MRITREPYVLVHSLSWRKDGKLMVIAHRHGQVVLEPFNKDLQSQRWYIGINGELFTRIGGVTRYLDYLDGCMGLVLSSTVPIQGWAFDAMGEHPIGIGLSQDLVHHRALERREARLALVSNIQVLRTIRTPGIS